MDWLLLIARWSGLLAVFFVLIQFFLLSRNQWLEKTFGFPALSRIHHTNGLLAFIFIISHPILLTISYARIDKISLSSQFIDFLQNYPFAFLAFLGFLIFIILTLLSLYIVKNKLAYETWYAVHLLAYIAVILAFRHQLAVGTDFLNHPILIWFWYLLYSFVFINLLLFRFFKPLINYFRYSFKVSSIKKETEAAYSVYITGRNFDSFPVRAGQFFILRFLNKSLWWQAHPFSLSQLPQKDELRVTIKNVGDFTNQIKNIKKNTPIIIEGPFGIFTSSMAKQKKILFISGGIGITPIRSLIDEMGKAGKEMLLLYSNRTKKEIVFAKELSQLAKQYYLKIIHVFTREPKYQGPTGRIDLEKIKNLVTDIGQRDIYICGPPPMLTSLLKDLKTLKIPNQQIHFEQFSL